MFFTVASGLASGVTGQGPMHNALLESFAIHARVLLSFLYAEDPRENDVVAEDFFTIPDEWASVRPPITENLKKVHRRVGKELAHLTYARTKLTDEMKDWPFAATAKEMRMVIDKFYRTVSSDLLGPSWRHYRNQGNDNSSL
jgi:hypothetical protein